MGLLRYAGGRQLLGFEVDNISSVQFSHMGAGRRGSILTAAELKQLIDGLDASGLLGSYTHVLTGWAGEIELLRGIADAVRRVRAANPAVVYVCDPVLGDDGALCAPCPFLLCRWLRFMRGASLASFTDSNDWQQLTLWSVGVSAVSSHITDTPAGLADIYRQELLPQANLITPNAFEAAILSGLPCTTETEGQAVCSALHGMGVPAVVITSIDSHTAAAEPAGGAAPEQEEGGPGQQLPTDSILMLGSSTGMLCGISHTHTPSHIEGTMHWSCRPCHLQSSAAVCIPILHSTIPRTLHSSA